MLKKGIIMNSHLINVAIFPEEELTKATITTLTKRQKDILELISQTLTNAEIASALVIAKGTVKTHLKTIYKQFEFNESTNKSPIFRLQIALMWLHYKKQSLQGSIKLSKIV